MPKFLRAIVLLAIPLAAEILLLAFVERNVDDRKSDFRRPHLRMLEAEIDGYAQDLGHLPTKLSDMLESKEMDWKGPYARARMLHDVDGADIVYEVVDPHTFRILLPARIEAGAMVRPAIVDVYRVGDLRSAAR